MTKLCVYHVRRYLRRYRRRTRGHVSNVRPPGGEATRICPPIFFRLFRPRGNRSRKTDDFRAVDGSNNNVLRSFDPPWHRATALLTVIKHLLFKPFTGPYVIRARDPFETRDGPTNRFSHGPRSPFVCTDEMYSVFLLLLFYFFLSPYSLLLASVSGECLRKK